jgi:predicted transposase/invertase (TIGR01784 family)
MTIHYHQRYSPSKDVVFAVIFGQRELFCKLAKAVTGDEVKLDNDPHTQATLNEGDVLLNQIRFDTFALAQNKKFYSLDMQRSYKRARQERRTIYYACRAVSRQPVEKMAYEDVKPVHISFILTSHKDTKPIRHIKLCDVDTKEVFDELLTMTQVYVPTVLKIIDKKSDLYIFAKFFKINNKRKANEFAENYSDNELGKELIQMYNNAVANVATLQEMERLPYFVERLSEAEIEEIKEKAKEKFFQEGLQEGSKETSIIIVNNMFQEGFAPEVISRIVKLDIDTINSFKDEN